MFRVFTRVMLFAQLCGWMPSQAMALQCIDLLQGQSFISSIRNLDHLISAPEKELIETLKLFSETTDRKQKSDLQGQELLRISKKARATLVSIKNLPPSVKSHLLKVSKRLDAQLAKAFRQRAIDTKWAVDWTYRYAQLVTAAYIPTKKINGEFGYEARDLLLGFARTEKSYDVFSSENFFSIKQLSEFWFEDSWYDFALQFARQNTREVEINHLDVFISDTEVGFEFFNQTLNISTQIFGFIYAPKVFDGLLQNPNTFFRHDFVHFRYFKSELMKNPRFKDVVEEFVRIYNSLMNQQSSLQAERLSMSTFLAEHEQAYILRAIYWALKQADENQPMSSQKIERDLLSLRPLAFIDSNFKKMPTREGKILAKALIQALQKFNLVDVGLNDRRENN